MPKKSEADIVREIYESIEQSKEKQKRLMSSSFWRLFKVKSRQKTVIDRIVQLLEKQYIDVSVKSGKPLGEEKDDDWVLLTLKIVPPHDPPDISKSELPPLEWFNEMQSKSFESEREVETYFIIPLLEKLGYGFDDIVIGHPIPMTRGVKHTMAEVDFAIFKNSDRDGKNILLVIEAKKSGKEITVDHISQAESYAKELLPACYVITNGQWIMVYQFNAMLKPNDRVMNFDRMELKERWQELYSHISKEATLKRKEWLTNLSNFPPKS